MMRYAQNRSEKSQDYLPWRDWPRAFDVLEPVCAPSGGGVYRGKILAGSVHARGATVVVETVEGAHSKIWDLSQVVVDAFSVVEIVTIPAAADLGEPVWLANLRDSSLSKDTETLGVTVRSILDSIKPNNYAIIDRQLASVDVTKATPSHLLAVLSSLFTWRSVLSEWAALRDKAFRHYTEKQVKGVERAFKGLM